MNRIIIDADPGVDDTLAIMMATKSEYIDLLGLSVVAGNCSLEDGIKNTFKILDFCDKNYIPVYKGAEHSLVERKIDAAHVHGENGFGNLEYEPIRRSPDGDAIDFLINTVNKNPKQITVVAIGPLTNIALAIMRSKDFSKNIKNLILMGSAKVRGNITSFAEFNFYKDPHAAKIVFDSDIEDIKVFGLNVTQKLTLKPEIEEYLKNSPSKIANTLYEITRTGAEFDRNCGFNGLTIHDPLTIAYLIDSNVCKMTKADIDILLDENVMGKSKIRLNENGKHSIAYEVNEKLFYNILEDNLLKKI